MNETVEKVTPTATQTIHNNDTVRITAGLTVEEVRQIVREELETRGYKPTADFATRTV